MKFVRTLVACIIAATLGACSEDATIATEPSAPVSVVSEPPMPEAPEIIELNPAKNVDENLFVLRMLEEHYRSVPDEKADREEIAAWLKKARAEVAWSRELIRKRKLDGDLDKLYGDFLRFADAYEVYRKKLGATEKKRNEKDLVSAGINLFDDLRSGKPTRRSVGQLATIVEDVTRNAKNPFDVINRTAKLLQEQSTTSAAAEKERLAFEKIGTEVKRRAQTTAKILTARHGWRGGESGFDLFESENLEEYIRRRPRDPFAKSRFAYRDEDGETYQMILRDAELCREAAELVPDEREYDPIRHDFFAEAVWLSLVAARMEAGTSGFSGAPRSASWARAYVAGYQKLDPNDASGQGHVWLARALAFSGRYAEAVAASKEALERSPDEWGNQGAFCSVHAALLSLEGKALDQVEGWIRQAYDRGYTPSRWLHESADFANFKRAYPSEFRKLTSPNLRTRIRLELKDDLILYNASEFQLTNVSVDVTVRQGEDDEWSTTVWCGSIPKEGTCTHEDILTIPGRFDSFSVRYDCDQCQGPIARSVNYEQNERMRF